MGAAEGVPIFFVLTFFRGIGVSGVGAPHGKSLIRHWHGYIFLEVLLIEENIIYDLFTLKIFEKPVVDPRFPEEGIEPKPEAGAFFFEFKRYDISLLFKRVLTSKVFSECGRVHSIVTIHVWRPGGGAIFTSIHVSLSLLSLLPGWAKNNAFKLCFKSPVSK